MIETKYGYGGNGNSPVEKAPELETARRELDKEISVLEESVKGLEARLVTVCLPSSPKLDKPSSEVQQPHSEAFLHLDSLRRRVVNLNIALADIKQRLEV